MKTFILIPLILCFELMSTELQWVDTQVQAIKPPRDGISKSKIDSIKDPFILSKKKLKEDPKNSKNIFSTNKNNTTNSNNTTIVKREMQPKLEAIINSSALINGQWYKIKDKVGKYTLNSLDKESIILSFKSKKLLLSIKTTNKNIKFKSD